MLISYESRQTVHLLLCASALERYSPRMNNLYATLLSTRRYPIPQGYFPCGTECDVRQRNICQAAHLSRYEMGKSQGEMSTKVNFIFPRLYFPRAPASLLRRFKAVMCFLSVVVLSEELLHFLVKLASSLLYLLWKHFSNAVCTSFLLWFLL